MIAVPKVHDEIPTMSFTIYNLDIITVHSTAFTPKKDGVASAAPITRDQFLGTEAGQILVDLWQAVLVSKGIEWITSFRNAPGRDWGTTRGTDRIRASTKIEHCRQNRPPNPLDTDDLLEEVLLERFPLGGSWCTASRDKDPKSTADTEAFLTFLKWPGYIAHPNTDTWLSDLNLTKPRRDHLVSIPDSKVLRETTHQRVQRWVPSLKAPVWFLNTQIGPPRSTALLSADPSRKRRTEVVFMCTNELAVF